MHAVSQRRRAKRRSGAHKRSRETFDQLVEAALRDGYTIQSQSMNRVELARGEEHRAISLLPGSAEVTVEIWPLPLTRDSDST